VQALKDIWTAIISVALSVLVLPFIKERLTRPKRAVLIILRYWGQPMSIHDLHCELKGSFGPANVDLALIQLEKNNQVTLLHEPDGIKFELPPTHIPPGIRPKVASSTGAKLFFFVSSILFIVLAYGVISGIVEALRRLGYLP
jgi:hypothetical protein